MKTFNHFRGKGRRLLKYKEDLTWIFLDSNFIYGCCCVQQRSKRILMHVLNCIPCSLICLWFYIFILFHIFVFLMCTCIFNVHVSSKMNTAGVGDFGKAQMWIGSTDVPHTMLTPAEFSLHTDLFLSCR
jgi:hypothetical protein